MNDGYSKVFVPFIDKTKYLTLRYTTKLSDFKNEEVKNILERAYSHDDVENRFLATLINCIFTQNSKTFIMTSRGFIRLMKNDINSNGKGVDYHTYKVQKRRLHDLNYIKTLRKPIGQKSGVYQLTFPYLLEMLHKQCSEEYFEAQEKDVLDFYNNSSEEKEEAVMDWNEMQKVIKKRR